jgi:hypothetical protein
VADNNHEVSVQLSVIEYVKEAITTERSLTDQKLDRMGDKFISIETARHVASETLKEQKVKDDLEYQRRLGELNNEKERLAKSQGESVSRNLFDARKETVDARLGTIEKTLADYAGRLIMLGAFMLVINIAVALFGIFYYGRGPH